MASDATGRTASLLGKAVIALAGVVLGMYATTFSSPIVISVLIVWLLLGSIGWLLGQQKGHGGAGLFLGVLLGPMGLLISAVMEPTAEIRPERDAAAAAALAAAVQPRDAGDTRTCPWCAETIKAAAIVCPILRTRRGTRSTGQRLRWRAAREHGRCSPTAPRQTVRSAAPPELRSA
jgi:hypothetical protein